MMRKADKRYLLAALALMLAAGCGEWYLDAADRRAVQEVQAASWEPVPALLAETAPAEVFEPEAEDIRENSKIETALVQQGYLREDVPLPYELQDALHTACAEFGVPYELGLALVEIESGFDPDAANGRCYGLCQLHKAYFPDNLSPAENLRAGMEYLGRLLERYADAGAALTAYNAGHDTGSRRYANTVLAAAERWSQ